MIELLIILSIPVAVSIFVLFGHAIYELLEHRNAKRKD